MVNILHNRASLLYNNVLQNRKESITPSREYIDLAINALRDTICIFENRYKDKILNIKFTNGEKYEFEINKKNLAHMLSVNTNSLKDTLIYKRKSTDFISSYAYLNKIVDNPDSFISFNDYNNGSFVNYYTLYDRCITFKKLSELEKFNFVGVDFQNDRILNERDKTSIKSNKMLLYKSNEYLIDYYLMAIVKCKRESNYYIETNFPVYNYYHQKKWNPKRFLENQILLIPEEIKIKNKKSNIIEKVSSCKNKQELIDFLYQVKNNIELDDLKIEDNNFKALQKA